MTINERIFNILEEKGLKQSDLAKKLELSTGQITAWKKRGTTPPGEYFINICKFLNISIYELLGADEEGLNQEERKLIEYFRSCSVGNKAIILNAAEGLSNKELQDTQNQETKSSDLKIG